jgi:hypothetical protein
MTGHTVRHDSSEKLLAMECEANAALIVTITCCNDAEYIAHDAGKCRVEGIPGGNDNAGDMCVVVAQVKVTCAPHVRREVVDAVEEGKS